MKKVLASGIVLIMILACSCRGSKSITQAKTITPPVLVDGQKDEWTPSLLSYDKSTKLTHGLTYDQDNLYVCLVAADEQTQMKILLAGITFSLDTLGGKKKHVTLSFPAPENKSFNPGDLPDPSVGFDKVKYPLLAKSQVLRLTGFKPPLDIGQVQLKNTFGINVAIQWDLQKQMIYEMAIPFKTIYGQTMANTDRVIGFRVTVNGMPKPDMPANIGPPGNGSLGGGMPSGGFPGAPPAGGQMDLFETQNFSGVYQLLRVK